MMARKSHSWAIYLHPAYYIRRPQKFAAVCLLFIMGMVFLMDRHNAARELEDMEKKLGDLAVSRQSLQGQLDHILKKYGDGDGALDKQQQRGRDSNQNKLKSPVLDGEKDGDRWTMPKETMADVIDKEKHMDGATTRRKVDAANMQNDDPATKVDGGGVHSVLELTHQQGRRFGPDDVSRVLRGNIPSPEEVENERRRQAVKEAFLHAWKGYETHAWGNDELQPLSQTGKDSFGGLGATIVDAMDTAHIMGLLDVFEKAKGWVLSEMNFDRYYDASVFETTIRVVGGLLSAYDLCGDEGLLSKAKELADRLLPAWQTTSGIPMTTINLKTGRASNPGWSGYSSILADLGTETLEFIGLSQRTHDPKYQQTVEKTITYLRDNIFPEDGLLPIYINPDNGQPVNSKITFGAMGDSFYEYLLKAWIQGGKTEEVNFYLKMWKASMRGMQTMIQTSTPSNYVYVAEKNNGHLVPKMDHLACFASGMLALGADGPEAEAHLQLAKELARTCYMFYESTASKLSGENYNFMDGRDMVLGTPYNILRPETVESFMILYRKTHDPVYRDWGWNIFMSFEQQCRTPGGYAGLVDVSQNPPQKDDTMQSFFLAETLKYLYLLFSPPTLIPLDQWVFNTEAHPLKIIPRLGGGVGGPNQRLN